MTGYAESLATIEDIMEHVAVVLKKDPYDIREINIDSEKFKEAKEDEGAIIVDKILPLLKEKASIQTRKEEIKTYNKVRILNKLLIYLSFFELE